MIAPNLISNESTYRKFQLSIRSRLSLLFSGFVVINLVAVGIGAIGLNRVRNSGPVLDTMGSERMLTYKLAYLANIRDEKTSLDRVALEVTIREDIQLFEKLLAAMRQGSTQLGLAPVTNPGTIAQLEKVADTWKIYRNNLEMYLVSSSQMEDQYLERINNLTSLLTNLIDVAIADLQAQTTEAANQSQNLLLTALAVILLSMPLTFFVVAQIIRSLSQVTKTAELMAQGEFNIRAATTSADEVGLLASTLNRMAEQIGDLLEGLKTRTHELEDALAYLNTIVDNLADGLLVTDPKSQITRYNPAFLAMFGFKHANLVGQGCQVLANPKVGELVEQTQTQTAQVLTAELELANGRIGQAVATAIARKQQNTFLGSVILIRDVTAEKEVDAMKTDFISTVSHELRTPLTSVLGFASIIQEKLQDDLSPRIDVEDRKAQRTLKQVQSNIDIIVSEAERLTSLINDVLDVAKMEAGKLEWDMQPICIDDVINRAIVATSSLVAVKGLELRKDVNPELPLVVGDGDRLIQVMINLISNAVKFTDQGHLTCKAEIRNGEMLVSVIDTGIGIATADQPKVFEKFKQVGDTLTDKPKGTGLGLPICKQIVEHHGGQIWVEGELKKGSTFCFTLPLLDSNPEAEKLNIDSLIKQLKEQVVTTTPVPSQEYKTILVVDDDAHIRELLRQELEAEGYKVQEAKDGMEAITQIKVARPDLILLDVMMPQMNGFDVAAILKNNPQTMGIPIIILSIIEDKERGYRLGIDRYLTKPINKEELFREIGVLIAQGTSNNKVLVVDKNVSTLKILSDVLQTQGFSVVEASDKEECIEKALSLQPDMIIVDSVFSQEHNLVKTLRFEKGMENIVFVLLGNTQADNN